MKEGLNYITILFFCICLYACNSDNSSQSTEENLAGDTDSSVVKQALKFQPAEVVSYPDAILEMYSPLGNENFEAGKIPFEFNIKNHPFGANRPLKLSINGGEAVEVGTAQFRMAFNPGTYRAIAYLVDDNGQALKEYGNFVDRDFTVGDSRPFPADDEPYFIVNLPSDGQEYKQDEKVMVDLLFPGGDLESDDYTLKIMVGETIFNTKSLTPLILEGLTPGAHEVAISLLDKEGKALSGIFTSYRRKIQVN